MKRLFLLFLFAIMFAGCQKTEPIPVPRGYRDSYALAVNEIIPKVFEKMNEREGDTAAQIYRPQLDPYLGLSKDLCQDETELEAIETALLATYNNATLNNSVSNEYTITFDNIRLECRYEPQSGAIQYVRFENGTEASFFEFIPLGNDQYACQFPDARYLITYSQSGVQSIIFSRTRYSLSMDSSLYEDDIIRYNSQENSVFNAATLDSSWLLDSSDDMMQIVVLDNEKMTISNRVCNYEFDEKREVLNRSWEWQEDILIEFP